MIFALLVSILLDESALNPGDGTNHQGTKTPKVSRSPLVASCLCGSVPADELETALRALDSRVGAPARSLHNEGEDLIRAANQRESEAWRKIASKEDWERYREDKLNALRESLGVAIEVPRDLHARVTRTFEGVGYRIENLVYESRPGLLVSANLYGPTQPPASMPGFVIVHSHHNPKTQGELQAMGVTWARLGCLVLVPDLPGHGERRQHPFVNAESWKGSFRAGRQDYWFRYVTGMQLHLAGESLVGWMAWDLQRGVDLLLSRRGIDKDRIALLGSVAGGGDPCAVAAALDPRIAAAVPFNFGGPQPESRFPLPEDSETSFNYAGGGSWESTRNLRLSARDGFLPWVIVGSLAPRRLVYGHEFSWDRERDPAWKRFERIWEFAGVRENLGFAMGRGRLSGKPPEATHCNNIGPEHLKGIYSAFEPWFKLPIPDGEAKERRTADELSCFTAEVRPKPLRELLAAQPRPRPKGEDLRKAWAVILGPIEAVEAKPSAEAVSKLGEGTATKLMLGDVPLLMLSPPGERRGVAIGVAQEGKAGFLKHRAEAIAELLRAGVEVALPDLQGTGENGSLGSGRGRSSGATSCSSTEFMLGRTLVGLRLGELRTVLRFVRSRSERMALWGDSFAPTNAGDRDLAVPLDAEPFPGHAEPLGDLLALLGALFEPDVKAVYSFGGLTNFASLLESPFCYVPHDVLVPGALRAGDLDGVTSALAPRPVCREGWVDGLNRRAAPGGPGSGPAKWLIAAVRR